MIDGLCVVSSDVGKRVSYATMRDLGPAADTAQFLWSCARTPGRVDVADSLVIRRITFQSRRLRMKRMLITVAACALLGFVVSAQAAGDAQAGKAKAGACAGCHGANGEGGKPHPVLGGQA